MITNGRQRADRGETPNVAASVSELTSNVIELTELQTQLLLHDLQKSADKAKACLILAVVSACLLLASIPVALLALGWLLVEQLGWSMAASMGVSALLGLLVSGIIASIAYGYVKNGLISVDQSRDELRRNVAWLKSSLRSQGRRPTDKPINY